MIFSNIFRQLSVVKTVLYYHSLPYSDSPNSENLACKTKLLSLSSRMIDMFAKWFLVLFQMEYSMSRKFRRIEFLRKCSREKTVGDIFLRNLGSYLSDISFILKHAAELKRD